MQLRVVDQRHAVVSLCQVKSTGTDRICVLMAACRRSAPQRLPPAMERTRRSRAVPQAALVAVLVAAVAYAAAHGPPTVHVVFGNHLVRVTARLRARGRQIAQWRPYPAPTAPQRKSGTACRCHRAPLPAHPPARRQDVGYWLPDQQTGLDSSVLSAYFNVFLPRAVRPPPPPPTPPGPRSTSAPVPRLGCPPAAAQTTTPDSSHSLVNCLSRPHPPFRC